MKKLENIIILAAGKSRRLWPIGDKNLVKFQGVEAITHQINTFSKAADKIVVVASKDNYEQIEAASRKSGIKKIKVIIQKGEGQAQGVFSCRQIVGGSAMVLNSGDFLNLETLLKDKNFYSSKYNLVLTAKKIKNHLPGGYLKFNGTKLGSIIEKPDEKDRPSDLFRLVADYFADFNDILDKLKEVGSEDHDSYEKAINEMLDERSIYTVYDDFFYPLKYPWHILGVMNHFLSTTKSYRGRKTIVDKTAIIEGDVYLDDNVKVAAYSKIVGPCFIGKNSIIGNYAMLRESMVGENCLIGGYSEVTRSYFGDRVFLHRNYVGDSVIDNDVLFGAGALTANFRFDGQKITSIVEGKKIKSELDKFGAIIGAKTKVGVNAAIMPGVKIGPGKFVSPQSFSAKDIL